MSCFKFVLFTIALSLSLFLFNCTEETPVESKPESIDYSNDYFPFTNSYTWQYSTNALSDSGKFISTFEMRIDTTTFNSGVFFAFLGRLPGTQPWHWFFAVKDSAGIVYSIGDNPPETPYPIFKHQYSASEGVRDSVFVLGEKMETVRIDFVFDEGNLSIWLAKGIGLVKESSDRGYSLFSDNNSGENVLIETTLQSLTK